MSYKQRRIKVQFTLENGKSFDSNGNVLTIDGAKCYVSIAAYGGMAGTPMTLQIWGLSIEHIAALSYMGIWINGPSMNSIKVWADDVPIYEGFINNALPDYNQPTETVLIITANAQYKYQAMKVSPFTAKGDQRAEDVIKAIASSIGMGFQNNGAVGNVLSNPSYKGNAVEQMVSAAHDAGVEITIRAYDVIIYKQGGPVDGVKLLVSPQNGLIGYPVFTASGLQVNTIFSSNISIGRSITVETSLPNASGDYVISGAMHYITSWIDGGQYHSSMDLIPTGTKAIRS